MKVNFSIDDDLMRRVDVYADENYMSRSGFVTLACAQYLNQMEAFKAIKEMSILMKKIADSGKVTPETLEQLEDMERLAKLCFSDK